MKKIQMNSENRALIESVVKESPKFMGNEDLLNIFCEAIYKKSYLLIDAIKDKVRLRRHLVTIGESCMEQIIRQKQKLNQGAAKNSKVVSLSKKAVLQEKKPPVKPSIKPSVKQKTRDDVVSLKEEIKRKDPTDVLIDPVDYSPNKIVPEQTVDKLIQIVLKISSTYPKKRYYELFFLRYIKGLDQIQTAREMRISQIELSKRFVELIKLTREQI